MIDDSEWQAQERAVAIERNRLAAAPEDSPRTAAYRVIARQLGDEAALPPLPAGLATAVLCRLRGDRSMADREAWFERGLPWWMVAGFGAATLALWLRGELPPVPGSAWMIVAGAAMLLAAWPFGRRGGPA